MNTTPRIDREHEKRVLATRRAIRFVPAWEGFWIAGTVVQPVERGVGR